MGAELTGCRDLEAGVGGNLVCMGNTFLLLLPFLTPLCVRIAFWQKKTIVSKCCEEDCNEGWYVRRSGRSDE